MVIVLSESKREITHTHTHTHTHKEEIYDQSNKVEWENQ